MVQITKIEVETHTKNSGEKVYRMWAVDNFGRDWKLESYSTLGGSTLYSLKQGKPSMHELEQSKDWLMKRLKEQIEVQNREFKRIHQNLVVSVESETIHLNP